MDIDIGVHQINIVSERVANDAITDHRMDDSAWVGGIDVVTWGRIDSAAGPRMDVTVDARVV